MIFNLAMDMKNALNFPKKTEFENIEKIISIMIQRYQKITKFAHN